MNTSTLAAAMSFVDDDLVSAAVDYKPKGKRLSMPYRIGASIAAACMVFIIGVEIISWHAPANDMSPEIVPSDSCVDITYDQSRQLDRANAAWYAMYRHQVPYFGTCYYDFDTDKIMIGLTENTPENQEYVLSLFGKFPVTFYQCDYSWLHLEELCDKLNRNWFFLMLSGVKCLAPNELSVGIDDVSNRITVLLEDDDCYLAKYLVTQLCDSEDVVVFKTVDEIPKNTAAPSPADAAVKPPVNTPRSPSASTAFLTPLASVLPKPVSGTVAPTPAQSASG